MSNRDKALKLISNLEKNLGKTLSKQRKADIEYGYLMACQEPVNEEKLDELAEEIMDKMTTLCQFDKEFNKGNRCVFKAGFKAGYRKAMEE